MELFKRKKPAVADELMALIDEPAQLETLEQQDVLAYLTELSEDEYKKLIAITVVYRAADKRANDIMDKMTDGDKIEVRIVEKTATDDFLETDTQVTKGAKGKTKNA